MKHRFLLLTVAALLVLVSCGGIEAQGPPEYSPRIVYVPHDDLHQAVTQGNMARDGDE